MENTISYELAFSNEKYFIRRLLTGSTPCFRLWHLEYIIEDQESFTLPFIGKFHLPINDLRTDG